MDISIIIVSFNTRELLIKCLKSVKEAVKNLKHTVFVVDNNSSDKTVEAVRELFPWVKLIANTKNLGFAKANNQALRKTNSKYVLILNPDSVLMPDTLIKMVKFMDENQNVAVASCRVELASGKLDRDCRRHFPTPWRAFCHFSSLEKLFRGSKIFDQYYIGYLPENKEHEIDSCAGAFMFIRTSAVKKVGYFDEDFFFYGEDLDWCFRFKKAGFKIVYTPITKIIHHKGASSGIKKTSKHITKATLQSKKRALKESTRAMEIFYRKHYLNKYPFFINWFVLLAIKILGEARLLTLAK